VSLVPDKQSAQIMKRLLGASRPEIYNQAEDYCRKKLPAESAPSPVDDNGIHTGTLQTIITSMFIHAAQDFLSRNSEPAASVYTKQADALEAAVNVVDMDGRRYYTSLMGVDNVAGERALRVLSQMAHRYREIARDLKLDKKNKTFFYCLGRRCKLAGRPLPTAAQANAVFMVLVDQISSVAPGYLDGVKTGYDTKDGGSEIRRLMKSGYDSV